MLVKTHSSNKEQKGRKGGTVSYAQKYPPTPVPTVQQLPRLLQRRTCTLCRCPGIGEKELFSFFQGKDSSEASEMFKIRDKCFKGRKGQEEG